MKKFLFAAILLLLGVVAYFGLQRYTKDLPTSTDKPTIVDFVNLIISQEDVGEEFYEMRGNWEKYLNGQPLPEDRSFILDKENGYMRYDAKFDDEGDGRPKFSHFTEFGLWDCDDSRYKLIVENVVDFCDGEPVAGQFSGITLYKYNVETQELQYASAYDLGIELDFPEDTRLIVTKLLNKEKSIEYECFTPSDKVLIRLTWNGSKLEQGK